MLFVLLIYILASIGREDFLTDLREYGFKF